MIARLNAALDGRYRVEREVGRGGMATVYLARDLRHDREVAIKVMSTDVAPSMGAERFLREIQLTARLQHEGVLPLLDSGEADGILYYVMPYVPGESLRGRIAREGQLPVSDAIRIAADAARALAYAHGQGIVHRDVKPENILLRGDRALVADFGIARLADGVGDRITSTGITVGTAAYMSPEQATGESIIDGRSDVYALGCVLYEMLAGEPPFTGPNPRVILSKQLSDPVLSVRRLRPNVLPGVDAAILKALARVPADRFATAVEFAAALDVAAARASSAIDADAEASRQPVGVIFANALRRWPVAVGLVAAIIVLAWILVPNANARDTVPAIRMDRFSVADGDTASAYLAATLQQDLLESLTSAQTVHVFVTASRGVTVDYALAGVARRSGDSVHLTVTLTRDGTGEVLKSVRASNLLSRVQVVPVEAATAILRALGRSPRIVTTVAQLHDSVAYDLFLRGRFQADRRTQSALQRSVALFGQAIARDSSFADAWAGLARALQFSLSWRFTVPGMPPDSMRSLLIAASARALDLDSTRAYTWIARGLALRTVEPGARHAVIAAYERAVTLDSNNADAWYYLGSSREDSLLSAGALAAYRRAVTIDPTHRQALAFNALHWMWARQYDSAMVWADSARRNDPGHIMARQASGFVRLLRGDTASAAGDCLAMIALGGGPDQLAGWSCFLDLAARRHDKHAVDTLLKRAIAVTDTLRPSVHDAAWFGYGLTVIGDNQRAIRLLSRFEPRGDQHFQLHLQRDPQLDALRNDPAFKALLTRGPVPLLSR